MQKLEHRSFHVYWILKVGVIQRLYHMIFNLEIIYLYLHFENANIWVKSILKGTAFQFEKLHFMY